MDDAPLFEVTTPTASAAARRLTTALKVRSLIGSASGDDAKLETIIDAVSAECARYCGLARPASMVTPPTFGQEVVKATWLITNRERSSQLVLPWRLPISAVGQVVEAGTNLTVNTDYRLIGGALLERIASDTPVCWSRAKIVVPYTAGWALPDGVPAEIEGQVIEEVKARWLGIGRDPAIRSEATPDVATIAYAPTTGGDGLLPSLVAALDAFRPLPV